jgi:ACR3 family arsenite transporter
MNWLKLKNHLDKYLPVYVTLAMIAGFYVGTHANVERYKGTLKTLNMLVVISMIYPMMINLRLGELKNSAKLGKQLTIALTMGLVISPLIMYGAIWLTELFHPINHQLALGLLLAVVVPCSSMSIAYTGFTKGNIELATIVVALSFTLAIVTVPGWLKVFASSYHVSISAWLLVKTILIVVITPMILGVLTRLYLINKLGPEGFLRIKPAFPIGFSNWANIKAINLVGAAAPTAIQTAQPLLTALFAYLILGETLTLWEAVAAALVLTGNALVARATIEKAP